MEETHFNYKRLLFCLSLLLPVIAPSSSSLINSPRRGFPTLKIDAPTIKYAEGYEVSVLNHCKERGFIRPVNPLRRKCRDVFGIYTSIDDEDGKRCLPDNIVEILLKTPIFSFHIIDLGYQRYFHKIHYEKVNKHLVTETDLDENGEPILATQRKYDFNIPKCNIGIIKAPNKPFDERKASPQETLIYTALLQRDIAVVDLEKYSMKDLKYGKDQVFSSDGDNAIATLTYKSPNCGRDGHLISVDADQIYEDMLAGYNYGGEGSGSGRFFGGEGSGSGIVKVNLHLPKYRFSGLRFKTTPFERLFGVTPPFHNYLVKGAYIPDSIVNLECLGDRGHGQ